MITSLSIKNYALIEDIKVDFDEGLTIITGETGAGKSILLGALGLLVGHRAEMKVVRDSTIKCVIEGEFSLAQYHLQAHFKTHQLDYEPQTIIRREILPSGKSRAFINDTPVTLQQMQMLGERLIDIHSQNDTQTLSKEDYQIQVIDALAGNDEVLGKYQESLQSYNNLKIALSNLIEEKEQAAKELDYHTFLYNELTAVNLEDLDQEDLEEQYEKLNHTEEIQDVLAEVSQLLSNDTGGSISTLVQARTSLSKIRNYSNDFDRIWERLHSVLIELEDISETISDTANTLEADPKQLGEIHLALQSLYKLQQKHTVASVSELIAIKENLQSNIENATTADQRIEAMQSSVEHARKHLLGLAEVLTKKRMDAIPQLKQKLELFLKDLGLPNAQFKFVLHPVSEFRNTGNTILEMLFTANKGVAFGSLQKVASGGERSRIMLAIKAVLSSYKEMPTLIFDEIDTGVSGEIAHKMAEILERMSLGMQLLSITHLPQIAAKGNHHKRVFKTEKDQGTVTQIKELNAEERILEIAQMIGGSGVSESAIAHAKQLLN